jgi:hypothetical protein
MGKGKENKDRSHTEDRGTALEITVVLETAERGECGAVCSTVQLMWGWVSIVHYCAEFSVGWLSVRLNREWESEKCEKKLLFYSLLGVKNG